MDLINYLAFQAAANGSSLAQCACLSAPLLLLSAAVFNMFRGRA